MSYDFSRFTTLSNTMSNDAMDMAISTFEAYFETAPNRHDDLVLNGVTVSGVIQKSRYAEKEYDDGILIVKNDVDAEMGYYLEFDGKPWLLTNEENRAINTHQAFRLTICNNEINWYNSDGVLKSRKVVKTSNQSLGISRDDEVLVLSGNDNLIMPYDDDTKLIPTNQRFIFNNHDVYIARNIKHSQFNGLITMSLERTEVRDGDDLDNNVAEYIPPNDDGTDIPDTGTTYEFNKTVFDITEGFSDSIEIYKYIDGVAQADTFTFDVIGLDLANYEIVSFGGNSIEIKALDSSYSGQLKATSDVDASEHFVDINLKSLW